MPRRRVLFQLGESAVVDMHRCTSKEGARSHAAWLVARAGA